MLHVAGMSHAMRMRAGADDESHAGEAGTWGPAASPDMGDGACAHARGAAAPGGVWRS